MPIFVAAPLLILLFAASAFPWLLILRARFGQFLAIPATAGGSLLVLLAVLVLSHALRINYMVAIIGASVIVGGVGMWLTIRRRLRFQRPGRYSIALWCPALLGGAIWSITVFAAQFVPGMSRFGWAMNGDALNNLSFATTIVRDNGIPLDRSTYSVPLSTAIIATGFGAGSPANGSAGASLDHQLQAFTLAWVILLVVLCAAVGVVCALLIKTDSLRLVALVSGLGSLLPLTWFFSGLVIQWGYFNIDLVLPILLAAWIVYLKSEPHPYFAFICLVGLAVLAFTSWTPIAALIAALGIALAVRNFHRFLALRRLYLVLIVVAIAISLGFVLSFVDFAGVFTLNGDLGATGAGFTGFVNLWWAIPIVAALAVLAVLAVRGQTTMPATSGLIGLLIAAGATTALLVYLASGDGELFTAYYPKKFAWLLLATLAVLFLSFLIGVFADRVRPSLIATLLVLSVLVAAAVPPGTWPEMVQRQPVVRISADFVRHDGEATVREILALSTSSHSTVLWQSGDPDEPIINEWLLLADGGLANANPKLVSIVGPTYFLYRSSGHYIDRGVTGLCMILHALNGKPRVVTANSKLGAELSAQCPGADPTIVVTTRLTGPIPSRTGQNWQLDGIEGPFN